LKTELCILSKDTTAAFKHELEMRAPGRVQKFFFKKLVLIIGLGLFPTDLLLSLSKSGTFYPLGRNLFPFKIKPSMHLICMQLGIAFNS